MDRTPGLNDSGFISSTSSVRRNLQFPSFESTPCSSKPNSRKRKSPTLENHSNTLHVRKLSDILENSQDNVSLNSSLNTSSSSNNENSFINSFTFDYLKSYSSSSKLSFNEISFNRDIFTRSSPVNNTSDDFKLSSSLEKFSLNESPQSAKKCKWDNEVLECRRKSNSAPGTPQRPEIESDNYIKKCSSLEFTPTKDTHSKIGTPERNEILYPQLVEVKPAVKPKSPQKLRKELKRIAKPSRKRLFPCKDFVYLFTNVKNLDNIISQVFSHLDDSDLVNVAKVSTLWKRCLRNDSAAFERYKTHVKNVTISKENIYFDPVLKSEHNSSGFLTVKKHNLQVVRSKSPPTSPARENWRKFTKLAAQLKSSQRLTKCQICFHPSVIEKFIAQCTKVNCGYLWCTKCMSGSKTGPADFNCTCIGSRSPSSPTDRSGLSDISNVESLYFSDEHSTNNASSGYFSQSDMENSTSGFHNTSKIKNAVLTDCNKNFTVDKRLNDVSKSRGLQHTAARERVKMNLSKRKDVEPTSPQKIKVHALGSKQSKKNLRRLCL